MARCRVELVPHMFNEFGTLSTANRAVLEKRLFDLICYLSDVKLMFAEFLILFLSNVKMMFAEFDHDASPLPCWPQPFSQFLVF